MTRLLVLATLAACASPHDVEVHYPNQGPSGAIEVKLNGASDGLTVAVNNQIMVDRKFSRRAYIDGVPIGDATVQIATGGGCEVARSETRTVDVQPGVTTSIVLPGTELTTSCAVLNGLNMVALALELVALGVIELGIPKNVSHIKG